MWRVSEKTLSDHWKVLSSALGKMELPVTKMTETWKGTDLGGQSQLNLASLSLRQRND